jgi:hypothetical protein
MVFVNIEKLFGIALFLFAAQKAIATSVVDYEIHRDQVAEKGTSEEVLVSRPWTLDKNKLQLIEAIKTKALSQEGEKGELACKSVYHPAFLDLMLKSFVRNLCEPAHENMFLTTQEIMSTHKIKGDKSIDIWSRSKELGIDSSDIANIKDPRTKILAGTYALMFGLSIAESHGNPSVGSQLDPSSHKFWELEEGFFQASTNALGWDYYEDSPKRKLASLLARYLEGTKLGNGAKPGDIEKWRARVDKMCMTTDVFNSGNGRGEYNSYFSSSTNGPPVVERTQVRITPDKLTSEFAFNNLKNAPSTTCLALLQSSKNPFREKDIDTCFHALEQFCPAFAIDLTAAALRTNLKHQGPLFLPSKLLVGKEKNRRLFKGTVIQEPAKQEGLKCSAKVFAALADDYEKLCDRINTLPPIPSLLTGEPAPPAQPAKRKKRKT